MLLASSLCRPLLGEVLPWSQGRRAHSQTKLLPMTNADMKIIFKTACGFSLGSATLKWQTPQCGLLCKQFNPKWRRNGSLIQADWNGDAQKNGWEQELYKKQWCTKNVKWKKKSGVLMCDLEFFSVDFLHAVNLFMFACFLNCLHCRGNATSKSLTLDDELQGL